MIINSTFKYLESRCLRINISNLEIRLLLLLSDNNFHSYNEIVTYLYNYDSKYTRDNLYTVLRRLKKKIDLNINFKCHEGLLLNERILIDR